MKNHDGDKDEQQESNRAAAHMRHSLPQHFSSASKFKSLEDEVQYLRQSNEDLKKTLKINKTLITELFNDKKGIEGLEQLVKESVWDIETALGQAREEGILFKAKIQLLENEVQS